MRCARCEQEARWEVVATFGTEEQSEDLCESHRADALAVFALFGVRVAERRL